MAYIFCELYETYFNQLTSRQNDEVSDKNYLIFCSQATGNLP